jgi:hypothetical protein
MTGNVAFLMKDVVLLAVSVYLLKQEVVKASLPEAERRKQREAGQTSTWSAEEWQRGRDEGASMDVGERGVSTPR